jgi:predicted transcriptional regulator
LDIAFEKSRLRLGRTDQGDWSEMDVVWSHIASVMQKSRYPLKQNCNMSQIATLLGIPMAVHHKIARTDVLPQDNGGEMLRSVALIVSSWLANNTLPPDRTIEFIDAVSNTLRKQVGQFSHDAAEVALAAADTIGKAREPAVPVAESIKPHSIICLEDGEELRVLTRYIRRVYGLTPAEYRTRWGLPDDYPMTAPDLSISRSRSARKMGLGRMRH